MGICFTHNLYELFCWLKIDRFKSVIPVKNFVVLEYFGIWISQ